MDKVTHEWTVMEQGALRVHVHVDIIAVVSLMALGRVRPSTQGKDQPAPRVH